MIRSYYRSPYVQKGYGLGSVFRGVAKFFRPLVRGISNTINRPEVKKVLKTMGKETLDTGSELLIDSLKGRDIESKLDKRIKLAQQRIANSIEEGINERKRTRAAQKYQRLPDNETDDFSDISNKYTKRKKPIRVREYQRMEGDQNFFNMSNNHKKRKPSVKIRKLIKRNYGKNGYRTVFD